MYQLDRRLKPLNYHQQELVGSLLQKNLQTTLEDLTVSLADIPVSKMTPRELELDRVVVPLLIHWVEQLE